MVPQVTQEHLVNQLNLQHQALPALQVLLAQQELQAHQAKLQLQVQQVHLVQTVPQVI